MQKENNKKIGLVVGGIVVLIAVFYGGMVYGKSQIPTRGQGAQAFGAGGLRGARTGGAAGGFTTGQIISKDATSITVSIQGGGSKIIFLDSNTKVSKQANGTLADLVVGTAVSISGAANADGSVNATTVQIRPNTPQSAKVQ